jgi:nicotinamidase/pyrazinamidase
MKDTSLLVVDAQRGFSELCPDELPVPGALAIVPKINQLLQRSWVRIDATQDWHPPDHCSFLGRRDNLYPPHCVAGTPGAEFLPALDTKRFQTIWHKGFERDRDAYAVTAQHPAFADFLKACGVRHVVICGIATNICCFFTARDLRQAGFEVTIVEDASAGLDVPAAGLFQPKAKADAERLGVRYVTTDEVLNDRVTR